MHRFASTGQSNQFHTVTNLQHQGRPAARETASRMRDPGDYLPGSAFGSACPAVIVLGTVKGRPRGYAVELMADRDRSEHAVLARISHWQDWSLLMQQNGIRGGRTRMSQHFLPVCEERR